MHVELRIGFGPGEIVSYTRVRNITIIFLNLPAFYKCQKIDIATTCAERRLKKRIAHAVHRRRATNKQII